MTTSLFVNYYIFGVRFYILVNFASNSKSYAQWSHDFDAKCIYIYPDYANLLLSEHWGTVRIFKSDFDMTIYAIKCSCSVCRINYLLPQAVTIIPWSKFIDQSSLIQSTLEYWSFEIVRLFSLSHSQFLDLLTC